VIPAAGRGSIPAVESATYAIEDRVEQQHWWFAGRRRLFAREIRRLDLPPGTRALDIGTGTGANLRLLRELGLGEVVGVDASPEAIRYCAAKGLGPVRFGDICALPLEDGTFDLVLATDVIEHVDDDGKALEEIRRVLRPGGRLLLTVPAFPSLWGLQDKVSHHRRRYRMGPLLHRLAAADLRVRRGYHVNWLLFGPIWLVRRLIDGLGIELASEAQLNTTLLNRLLGFVFAADTALAPLLRPPFGVTILIVAERPPAAADPEADRRSPLATGPRAR
jgi:SAM-dependent methyltransferase